MPSKRFRLVLGLLLPVAVAAFGVWKLRGWKQRAVERIEQELPAVPIPTTAEIPLAPESAPAKKAALSIFEMPSAARTSGKPALAGTTLVLEGIAATVDASGKEQRDQDGSFELELRIVDGRGAYSQAESVAVRKGRWSVTRELPRAPELADLRWSARSLVLTGRPVRSPLLSDGLDELDVRVYAVPENGVLALVGRVLQSATVEVVAGDTREPLREIEVRTLDNEEQALDGDRVSSAADHPASELSEPSDVTVERLLAGTASPVEIEGIGMALYWIRAPGYAWGRIAIDHERGGKRRLVLEPAGELVARLEDWRKEWNVRLRIYRRNEHGIGSLVAQREPASSGVTRIDGLAAGAYDLRAEVGRAREGDRPLVLRSSAFDLRARESSDVTLKLALPRPVPAPLGGTLVWPFAWRAVEAELVIRPWEATPLRDRWIFRNAVAKLSGQGNLDETLSWNAGEVAPGSHLAEVRPLRHYQILDVGPRGLRQAAIDIPRDWSGVRIRLVRVGSVEPTPVRWLLWRRVEGEPPGVAPFAASPARAPDAFDISTLPGVIRLAAVNRSHRYALEPEVVTARSGGTEAEIRVLPACRARIVLRENGAVVPADPLWLKRIEFRRVDSGVDGDTVGPALTWPFEIGRADVSPDLFDPAGGEELLPHSLDGARARPRAGAYYDVTLGGEYELRFAPMSGFRPIAARRVTLTRGVTADVVIDLEADG